MYTKKSYLTVLNFMTQYFALPEPETDLTMEDAGNNKLIRIITDSDGDIQVSFESNDGKETELDGGGLMVMQDGGDEDDELNEELEGSRIEGILERGDPEEINDLVTEKALFIWELIHTS